MVYFWQTLRAGPSILHVRILYSILIYLLAPLVLIHLAYRGLRDGDYLKRWGERLALPASIKAAAAAPGGIVLHAVSVGEVNAAAPLIRALLETRPQTTLTVTCFTPTGSNRLRELFSDEVQHLYLPLDLPGAVRRFFRTLQPDLLIIMETEIWPNLYARAAQLGLPVLIVNGRISNRSLPRYRRLKPFIAPALQKVAGIGAQSEVEAGRFCELGAPAGRVTVTGNLKFDLRLPDALRQQGSELRRSWGSDRPVVVAGSTHEGDEAALFTAFKGVLIHLSDALMVLVPRHPERFARVAEQAKTEGLSVHRLSDGPSVPSETQCLVVDAMGQLLACYAAADLAFVGGSLENRGGHNVLEPAALGIPVLMGPHTHNFADISEGLVARGGARRAHDAIELESAMLEILQDAGLRRSMGAAALEQVHAGQGALARTLEIVTRATG